MLLFYGATRAADTLTLARLDRFVDSYDKTSAFNNHGNGPPKSRFEVVTNLAEVTAEYKRVMEARRAAGNEAMPDTVASPDKLVAESGAPPGAASGAAESGAESEATASAKDHLLGNNAVQFHANDFEAKATAKAAVKAAVKAVKAVK